MRTHCQRCEDKEAELAYLRSELALIDDLEAERKIRTVLELHGPTEARILLHFSRCRHHTATRLQLADLLKNDDADPKCVDVFMSRIRTRFGQDMFETLWGQGCWRLTPVGLAKLEEILNDGQSPVSRHVA